MKSIFKHECSACGEHDFEFHEGVHQETTYKWVCECGAQMQLRFYDRGKQVEQMPTGVRSERTLALLRTRGNPSFMFIYGGVAWRGELEHHKFHYEENTCPTSLMRCLEIIADGECDPHGIFELVEEHLVTGPNAEPYDDVFEQLKAKAVKITDPTTQPPGHHRDQEPAR